MYYVFALMRVCDSESSSWITVSEKIQRTDDKALLACSFGLLLFFHVCVLTNDHVR